MNRLRSILWPGLVAWVCSALIHTTDADIGGVRGLFEPTILASVCLIGVGILIPMLLCQYVLCRYGLPRFIVVVVVEAVGMGLVLVIAGSTAQSALSWVWSLVGSSAMFVLVLFVAAIPVLRTAGNRDASAPAEAEAQLDE